MTRRTRVLFLILGIATLAAAIWIAMNLRLREIRYTDDAVDIELISPAAPPPPVSPTN